MAKHSVSACDVLLVHRQGIRAVRVALRLAQHRVHQVVEAAEPPGREGGMEFVPVREDLAAIGHLGRYECFKELPDALRRKQCTKHLQTLGGPGSRWAGSATLLEMAGMPTATLRFSERRRLPSLLPCALPANMLMCSTVCPVRSGEKNARRLHARLLTCPSARRRNKTEYSRQMSRCKTS